MRGGWKVGDKNLPLFVSVTAPDVDPEIVGVALEVQGSGKTLELKRYDQVRDLWTGSLRELIVRPGVVRLAATVTMSVAGRKRRTASLPLGELRLQNLAPAIMHQPAADSDVQNDTFPFQATIRSTVPATAILTLNANPAIRLPIGPHRLQEISQSLKLRRDPISSRCACGTTSHCRDLSRKRRSIGSSLFISLRVSRRRSPSRGSTPCRSTRAIR